VLHGALITFLVAPVPTEIACIGLSANLSGRSLDALIQHAGGLGVGEIEV
jgi:hypothetical protein